MNSQQPYANILHVSKQDQKNGATNSLPINWCKNGNSASLQIPIPIPHANVCIPHYEVNDIDDNKVEYSNLKEHVLR